MQEDFHYYATYCAAYLAGYSHEESLDICYSAQFVDCCSRTFLKSIGAPLSAATTQLQLELADVKTDLVGLQDITRIWSSFHFLPYDLHATKPGRSKKYLNKYRLICNSNGELVSKTVALAKNTSLQAVGIAMHVLADTWAHKYFAGTPSLVINSTDWDFYEIKNTDPEPVRRQIKFVHNPTVPDCPERSQYTSSLSYGSENSIMNLGHGRAGHLPDYSFIRYSYLPAWNNYEEVTKDNPSDYYHAFAQMVYAMRFLKSPDPELSFALNTYAFDQLEPYQDRIMQIITKQQLLASEDWKAFGESLSNRQIPDFDINRFVAEYKNLPSKNREETYLGKFIAAATSQKTMVTNEIFCSGNLLAGFSKEIHQLKWRDILPFMNHRKQPK